MVILIIANRFLLPFQHTNSPTAAGRLTVNTTSGVTQRAATAAVASPWSCAAPSAAGAIRFVAANGPTPPSKRPLFSPQRNARLAFLPVAAFLHRVGDPKHGEVVELPAGQHQANR